MSNTTAPKFVRNKYGQYIVHEWVTMWGQRKLVTFTITKGKPSYNGFTGWLAEWKLLSIGNDWGTVGVYNTLAEAKDRVARMVAQGYGTVEVARAE